MFLALSPDFSFSASATSKDLENWENMNLVTVEKEPCEKAWYVYIYFFCVEFLQHLARSKARSSEDVVAKPYVIGVLERMHVAMQKGDGESNDEEQCHQ
jgi:hypothetical protein